MFVFECKVLDFTNICKIIVQTYFSHDFNPITQTAIFQPFTTVKNILFFSSLKKQYIFLTFVTKHFYHYG